MAAALVDGSQVASRPWLRCLLKPPLNAKLTRWFCGGAQVLTALDDRLARAGLPRVGSPAVGASTALNGHLPLVVALRRDPLDPALLLEFSLLPDGPFGRKTGNRLAAALAQFPGLDSCSWEDAIVELTAIENDPEGKIAKRLVR